MTVNMYNIEKLAQEVFGVSAELVYHGRSPIDCHNYYVFNDQPLHGDELLGDVVLVLDSYKYGGIFPLFGGGALYWVQRYYLSKPVKGRIHWAYGRFSCEMMP